MFTHISEAAHDSCLQALHAALNPGGCLIVTVRPPQYLWFAPQIHAALSELGADPQSRLEEPRYVFVPHEPEPTHLQYDGSEMTYGEAVVTLPYIRERWSPLFELVDIDLLVGDLYHVMVTLRRR